MATLPKVLISRADYQIGGGVALGFRTQGPFLPIYTDKQIVVSLSVFWSGIILLMPLSAMSYFAIQIVIILITQYARQAGKNTLR
jgi:hypothetical protein